MGFLSVFRAPAVDDLADDEFDPAITAERERRHQLLRDGELELDYTSGGIAEVHWRPRRMRWTKDPPAGPGLYGVRVAGGARRVVEVYKARNGTLMASWTDIPSFPVAGCGFEFSNSAYPEIDS